MGRFRTNTECKAVELKCYCCRLPFCFIFRYVYFNVAHSLRHKPTGMCLHLYGMAPREGVECCLWQGCDEERTKVTFMKQGKPFMEANNLRSSFV